MSGNDKKMKCCHEGWYLVGTNGIGFKTLLASRGCQSQDKKYIMKTRKCKCAWGQAILFSGDCVTYTQNIYACLCDCNQQAFSYLNYYKKLYLTVFLISNLKMFTPRYSTLTTSIVSTNPVPNITSIWCESVNIYALY